MNQNTVKTIRINLIIFAILHFFYIIATSVDTHVKPNVFGIFVQYWISSWIIRKFVIKTKEDESKTILYTWLVSIAVFIARILLGLIFFSLMDLR